MKIIEIFYDADKYPFSGIKQLLLLGLMILITTSILGYCNLRASRTPLDLEL